MCCTRFRLPALCLLTSKRSISSSEVINALRPFYFAVHPDFFSNYPLEKEVNENSLKQLNGILDVVASQGRVNSVVSLKFFMRSKEIHVFQPITVKVNGLNIGTTVESILKACGLPVDGIKKLSKLEKKVTKPSQGTSFSSFVYKAFVDDFSAESWSEYEFAQRRTEEAFTLENWLKKNAESAKASLKSQEAIRGEIEQLSVTLINELKLKDLKWDCGWNVEHLKGSLQSLNCLASQHPTAMASLQGKTVVFGHETGVNLYGHVSLNSGEVRHNWLDLIQRVDTYDRTLGRIPSYEKALSRALREIRITRRCFGPSLLADDYELELQRLVTAIGDYKCRRNFPLDCPSDLSHLQLVVETAAGPLTLTPTGQIVTPSSCPIFLLLGFIAENHLKAKELLDKYSVDHKKEEDLQLRCLSEFSLYSLGKDDSITPSQMIEFMEKLLQNSDTLQDIRGSKVCVTHYYSVLADGEICIPWNFF